MVISNVRQCLPTSFVHVLNAAPLPRQILLAVPGVILLHNAEEALTMPTYLPVLNAHLPGVLRALLGAIAVEQFLLALAVVTVLPFLVLPRLRVETQPGWGHVAMLALLTTMLLNVGSHVGMAVLLGGYAPGLGTALGLILPGFGYGAVRAVRERWVSRRTLALLPLAALVLHGPVLVGLLLVAGRLVPIL